MRYLAGIALLLTCALGANPARAQNSYETVTRPHAEMMDGFLVQQCTQNDRSISWLALEEISYPLLGDRRAHDDGVRIFTERYEASGCGASPRRINIQVFHGGPRAQNPVAMPLPPGETAISAGIMTDLFRTHIPQLLALHHPTCRTAPPGQPIFLVTDTHVISGSPFVVNETWTERWDYRACEAADLVDISFTSNGDRVTMTLTTTSAP
jgi:hypothetical protein